MPQQDNGRLQGNWWRTRASPPGDAQKLQNFSLCTSCRRSGCGRACFHAKSRPQAQQRVLTSSLLKPVAERKISADPGHRPVARKTGAPAAAPRFSCRRRRDIRVGGRGANAQYQYTRQCGRPQRAARPGSRASARPERVPLIVDVSHRTSRTSACKPAWWSTATPHAPRRESIPARLHAQRPLRPTAGLDHLQPSQPIPRRDWRSPAYWQNPPS